MAAEYATQAGSTPVRPSSSALDNHASTLAAHGERIAIINERLVSLLGRMNGPSPLAGPTAAKDVSPVGVLHVATFASERISREIEVLNGLVEQLERVA